MDSASTALPIGVRRALTAFVVAAILVHLVRPSGVVGDASHGAVVCLGAGLAWWGVLRAGPGRRKVAVLVASGLALSALGDLIEEYLLLSGLEVEFSPAEVPYYLSYVGLIGALLVLLTVRAGTRIDVDAVIDVLTVITVSLLVFWNLAIHTIVSDQSLSGFARAVRAGYPIADAILFALAVRALTNRRTRSRVGAGFCLGVACWLAADLGYLLLDATGFASRFIDIGWMLGAVLMAQLAWRAPPVTEVGDADEGRHVDSIAGRLAIAIGPLLVPPVIQLVSGARAAGDRSYVFTITWLILLVLAFVRTARLLQSETDARREAARSRRYHARMAENSTDAVMVVDGSGAVMSETPAVLVAGPGDWVDLLGCDDPQSLRAAFRTALAAPRMVVTTESRCRAGDAGAISAGSEAWFGIRLVNLLGDPDVRGVVVALSDITERKAIESELEKARDAALEGSRAKSTFLATMSHEIRTPMNGMIGLSGLLLGTQLNQRQRQYTEGIETSGVALMTVINDILDFSKVEAGRLQLEHLDFDLVQVVEEAAATLAETAQGKGLELLAYCAPEVPLRLRGDPGRIRQVLLNLAGNAVKFTPAGEVVIHAEPASSRSADGAATSDTARPEDELVVRFEVTDTGIGIDPEERARMFEPFAQADSSTTREYGGTGLGLAISTQLVDAMGGRLGVLSAVGGGSTFWFELPLRPAAEPVHPTSDAALPALRVLVVDDNDTSRRILRDQLAAWGMRVTCADSGAQALQLLGHPGGAAVVDLVILDLCMPGMDGLELATTISATPHPVAPALVLLTSGPDLALAAVDRAGLAACMTKPVQLSRLQQVLHDAAAGRAGPGHPATPAEQPARGHVLIVDDGEINQLVAAGILRQLGFSSDTADDGLLALEALARSSYDVVLMDVQMPRMDGYEATRRVRDLERGGRRTPIVAMTAGVVHGDRERALAAGMDDYVSKPIDPVELATALEKLVDLERESTRPLTPG